LVDHGQVEVSSAVGSGVEEEIRHDHQGIMRSAVRGINTLIG